MGENRLLIQLNCIRCRCEIEEQLLLTLLGVIQ